MNIDKVRFLDSLANAAYAVSVEKLFLTDSYDAPIYPESLVQVVVAQHLHRALHFSRVELEYPTGKLERELFGGSGAGACKRVGRIDVVCWGPDGRVFAVEVKDELTGTNDGLAEDARRIQDFLSIQHRLLLNQTLSFGGLVAFVGKSSQQYAEYSPFDHQLDPWLNRSVETVKRNIENAVNKAHFDVEFKVGRCVDSSRDGTQPDPNIGTEDEDPLSGEEQMTKFVVAVISRRPASGSNCGAVAIPD